MTVMKQWVCIDKMKGAQNFRMSEHFYFGLVLWKAMMLAVFFKLVFIVCIIRALQVGNRETLQSQQCSKNENINTLLSTTACNPEGFYSICLFSHIGLELVCSYSNLKQKRPNYFNYNKKYGCIH